MSDFWYRVPLAGSRVVIALCLIVVIGVLMAVQGRHSKGWRRAGIVVAVVAAVAVVGAAVNTRLDAYPNVGSLSGVPRYPMVNRLHPTSNVELERGAAARMSVPDTASKFGVYDAQVYLPPQYFSEPNRRFPVVILTHGNPGRSTDWLDAGSAAETGLAVARAGTPVILVMPTVLQHPEGDSLCVNTASQGNAETYVVKDVVAAADSQLRTIPDAAHRGIGGFSMGGFCALNLGLKHPDVFSTIQAFSALTVCEPDAIDGGNEALFGTPDWEEQVEANSPADYWKTLDPKTAPAMWLDVGDEEATLIPPLEDFADELSGAGFTVQFHERDGGHDFDTWTPALQESLPWAAARLSR
ncbi:MAG TPA: alpha/beta hydrolase-fold protein [Lapillicoccus sp.]|nr:alpha/beta hydrolase-fold protein [Lapillicoccus sp.]